MDSVDNLWYCYHNCTASFPHLLKKMRDLKSLEQPVSSAVAEFRGIEEMLR